MYDMTNKEIIKAHEYYAEDVLRMAAKTAVLLKVQKEVDALHKRINAAEAVSYIHKDVPMIEIGGGRGYYDIYPVSRGMCRWAHIFRNAANGKRWGLTLRHNNGDNGGKCVGANWKTKKACVKAAKEWVALGRKPEECWRS